MVFHIWLRQYIFVSLACDVGGVTGVHSKTIRSHWSFYCGLFFIPNPREQVIWNRLHEHLCCFNFFKRHTIQLSPFRHKDAWTESAQELVELGCLVFWFAEVFQQFEWFYISAIELSIYDLQIAYLCERQLCSFVAFLFLISLFWYSLFWWISRRQRGTGMISWFIVSTM